MGLKGVLSGSGKPSDFAEVVFVKDLEPFLAMLSAFIQDLDARIHSKFLDDFGKILVAFVSLLSAAFAVILTALIYFETTDQADASFRHMIPGRWGSARKRPTTNVYRNTLMEVLLGFKLLIPLAVSVLSVISTRTFHLKGYNYKKADFATLGLTYAGGFIAHLLKWLGSTGSVKLGVAEEEAETALAR